MTASTPHKYTAYYCEENIWHLCQEERFDPSKTHIVFISNKRLACPLWYQRACVSEAEPVLWDYHVILLYETATRCEVWDLDTLLGMPVELKHYARRTFMAGGPIEPSFEPRFKLIATRDYVSAFQSDRSHMKRSDGSWMVPPPAWKPIMAAAKSEPITLQQLIDMDNTMHGPVYDLFQLLKRYEVVQ